LKNRRISWARLISDILSPPVIWGLMAFPIAFRSAESQERAVVWALTYSVLVCILPALYIGYMVWRGHITDIHVQVRQQRVRPFIVSLVCTGIAWTMLRVMDAPSLLPLFAIFSLIQLAVMLLITLLWQISMHSMSITGAVVLAGALYGPGTALLLSPLIPVVGAARIRLRRHTPAQVVAGGLLGALLTWVMFLLSLSLA
jgi:membrane-associated phospholipid phosphatase